MCLSPNKLDGGTMVACRECWQCRARRVDDWVGRCIAESKTARAAHSMTLTYGRDGEGNSDHLRAALLTYSDVQKYFKLLRRHGFPCRYFAVGEYGSKKGRSHWHLIVFWDGPVPEHVLKKDFMEKHWPHGWSFWETLGGSPRAAAAAVRYCCKYLQKDIGKAERQGHFSMSKKPPLGAEWFRHLAGQYVGQGLSPQDLYYRFPEVKDEQGRAKEFMLPPRSASADFFCAAFLELWAARHGGFPPYSPLIEEYEDRMTPQNIELRFARFAGRVPVPKTPPAGGTKPVFSDTRNCFYSDTPYGRQWWSYNTEGDLIWHENIRPSISLEAALQPPPTYRDLNGRL